MSLPKVIHYVKLTVQEEVDNRKLSSNTLDNHKPLNILMVDRKSMINLKATETFQTHNLQALKKQQSLKENKQTARSVSKTENSHRGTSIRVPPTHHSSRKLSLKYLTNQYLQD